MNTQSSMALWGEGRRGRGRERDAEGGRERGEGEEVGEREGGWREKRDDSTMKAAANSPPSQKEKADHQYEALSPNTIAQKNLSNRPHT